MLEQAATLAELREACPGARNDFLIQCLDQGATVDTAAKAHAKALAAENAALKQRRGVDPIGGDASAESSSGSFGYSPNVFMQDEIAAEMDKPGMTRDRAARRVFQKHPGLREAVVEEANSRRRSA
jgi:hypothetical protein